MKAGAKAAVSPSAGRPEKVEAELAGILVTKLLTAVHQYVHPGRDQLMERVKGTFYFAVRKKHLKKKIIALVGHTLSRLSYMGMALHCVRTVSTLCAYLVKST